MKTRSKITIGIVVIIGAGVIGFLISNCQIKATKADKEQIVATSEADGAGTGQGGAGAPGKALHVSVDEHSKEQAVMDKDEEEGWNALMEVIDEVTETADSRTTAGEPGTSQTESEMEDRETGQDQPEMEYHESYNTFISLTRDITQTKSEMDRAGKELERMYDDWKNNVSDPKNPTPEEKAELEEIGSMKEETGDLWSDYNSLANELVSKVEAVVPGAIQTESQDYSPKGTMHIVRIDYSQIQSELGSAGERIDRHLSDFFSDFQVESWEEGDYGGK